MPRYDESLGNNYSALEARNLDLERSYTKTVSIIIPFYRGLPLLARTLAGLVRQTYPRELTEVIVAEDGDTGDSITLFSILDNRLPIRLVQHPRRGYRLATTRNEGILAAENEVICLLDFDVIPTPETVEAHMRWFHLGVDLATIGPRKFVDASQIAMQAIAGGLVDPTVLPDVPSCSNRFDMYDNREKQFSEIKQHPFPFNCFHGCNVAFLRSHALEIGLFDESFNGSCGYEDIEFGMRLWKRGNYLVYEPAAVGVHQENDIVTREQRERGKTRNLALLCSKAPDGYRQYRRSIGKDVACTSVGAKLSTG